MEQKEILNMQNILFAFTIIIGILLFVYSSSLKPNIIKDKIRYNIIVLLDLSDRVKDNRQVIKDKSIVSEIVSIFEDKIKQKGFIHSKNDRLKISIAPGSDNLNYPYSKLVIDMGKSPTLDNLNHKKRDLIDGLGRVYKIAEEISGDSETDIWNYFRLSLKHDIVSNSETNIRNILVIITDGLIDFDGRYQMQEEKGKREYFGVNNIGNKTSYMQLEKFIKIGDQWENIFERDGHGLIVFDDMKFSNLEILVLEMKERYEHDKIGIEVVKKYWYQWATEMNISKPVLTYGSKTIPVEAIHNFFNDK